MKKYNDMSDNEKCNIIKELYEINNKSFKDIADTLNTYANKIRRDAIKFKIKIRDKSEAQKNALITGKHIHPTKGKARSIETKNKIGASVLKSWDILTDAELNIRKQKAKENWNNLTEDERVYMQRKANEAVRKTSKEGSKLEKFIFESLIQDGYKVIFHQEQSLLNTKLQIDIFIPNLNLAIEIDGPSHFAPVWGGDALKRNIKYDQKKAGLIIGKGLSLVRIKQTKDFSKARSILVYAKLKQLLLNLENDKASSDKIFELSDE